MSLRRLNLASGEPEKLELRPKVPPSSLEEVDWTNYDFLDLGSSAGDSIPYCEHRFGARRGLGLDNDPAKVARARRAGRHVVLSDGTRLAEAPGLSEGKRVRFVSMVHFLEHLPNAKIAEMVVRSAAEVATDFLFIRHPSFEGEAYLSLLGLRQYWWHWTGHPNHLHISDYCGMFDRLGLHQYLIRYRQPLRDSMNRTILTTEEPMDQHKFDPAIHRMKRKVMFVEPLWREQEIFVALRAFDTKGWAAISKAA
jgi:hypothetical protein